MIMLTLYFTALTETPKYIKHEDTTACVVYWLKLAWNIHYPEIVTRDARIVARKITQFIEDNEIDQKIGLENITLVGHGIGAHIAGFVGQHFIAEQDTKIGAIYALDPAGPLYTNLVREKPENRLDKHDAEYVQTICTNMGGFGAKINLGHQNFRPNLGLSPQLPCAYRNENKLFSFDMKCSHEIATDYFRYSLNPKNKFVALRCTKERDSYLRDKCHKERIYDRMGIHAKRDFGGTYYLEPFGSEPYSKNDINVMNYKKFKNFGVFL
ncbi:lipase member H-like [Culicoides brevitarsis]|uniref:lipase member H-like n=1 Tax=Culicoides brevitarsis TaxID=469753 RepID=UPI00307C02FF